MGSLIQHLGGQLIEAFAEGRWEAEGRDYLDHPER